LLGSLAKLRGMIIKKVVTKLNNSRLRKITSAIQLSVLKLVAPRWCITKVLNLLRFGARAQFSYPTAMLSMKASFPMLVISIFCILGCSPKVATPDNIKNSRFPSVQGTSLRGETVAIPDHFTGKNTLLLVGYVQRAQFDIDRWILGVLQADVKVEIVEVPTIAGMLPQMVQSFIDNGMRSGIPKDDWGSVVTVYGDAPKIIEALGNDRPQSAYAVLLDRQGRIIWTSNIGYSAAQVIELKKLVDSIN
jgi:hypothetical protein